MPYLRVYDYVEKVDETWELKTFYSLWYQVDMDGQVLPSIFYTGFDVAVGNMDGSGLEEIVFTWPAGDSIDHPYPQLTRKLSIFSCGTTCEMETQSDVPDHSELTFLDRLEVADLNQDLKDEMILVRSSGYSNSFHIALDVYTGADEEGNMIIEMKYGYVISHEYIPRSTNWKMD